MASATFAEFAASSRSLLTSLMRAAPAARPAIALVTGNEAADLDSIASALSLAFLRHKLAASSSGDSANSMKKYISMINIPRADLPLRPDAMRALHRAFPGDTLKPVLDGLVFASDLDLPSMDPPPEFLLTDHNALAPNFSALPSAPRVLAIVDHHADQGKHPEAETRRIDLECGSATSLVAEEFKASFPDAVPSDPDMPLWTLMLSAVLVDTINLDPKLGRCFPVDVDAADYLYKRLGISASERPAHQKELFDLLQAAKFDVSDMTTRDLLRKDYKAQGSPLGPIGISTVTWHLEGLFSRGPQEILDAIAAWVSENSLVCCMVMTAYEYSSARGFERELLVVWKQSDAATAGLVGKLEASSVIGLEKRSFAGVSDKMSADGTEWAVKAYKMNEGISRKKLMPVLDDVSGASDGKL